MSFCRYNKQIYYKQKEVADLNIAICDDESIIREQIKNLIEKQELNYTLKIFSSGQELLEARLHFDIIFLDIQMEGINGIDTARKLRERGEEAILIFITGLKEYVFDAFDVSAFHYLLKPVEEEKFHRVFHRALEELKKREQKKHGEHQKQEQFFVKTRTHSFTINKNDILFIENRARKVEIHTRQEMIEIYAVMNELEQQLGQNFYRCHRGYLVNMAYIVEYTADSIQLNTGETVYLAKGKYSEFVKIYMRYLKRQGVCLG